MNKDELKSSLTIEQVIEIVASLGSDCKFDLNGNPYFQTICHNHDGSGNWKLYYYDDIHSFRCFTDCNEFFDIFKLVEKVKKIPFVQALNYVGNFCGFGSKNKIGFINETFELTDDWDLINKYSDYDKILQQEEHEYEIIPKGILSIYDDIYPSEWIEDNISRESLDLFDIKMDFFKKKIIIPHYSKEKELIGIRARNLDSFETSYLKIGKYLPVYLQDKMYSHNLSYNLYGLNITQKAIERNRKIILFESEKSVMKCQDFYGDNNFAVAICGHSISKIQRNIILSLGINEVFIAFDKDYTDEESDEGKKCAENVLKECYKFSPYVTTYLLWDTNELNLLGYKDAPCDKGKTIFETLLKNKFEVLSKEGEKNGRKRKTTRNV